MPNILLLLVSAGLLTTSIFYLSDPYLKSYKIGIPSLISGILLVFWFILGLTGESFNKDYEEFNYYTVKGDYCSYQEVFINSKHIINLTEKLGYMLTSDNGKMYRITYTRKYPYWLLNCFLEVPEPKFTTDKPNFEKNVINLIILSDYPKS